MHDLQLVGFTTDRRGLIFRTRAGARPEASFVVPVTDELVELVTQLVDEHPTLVDEADGSDQSADAARPSEEPPARPRSQMSVRDIQARLRVGEPVPRIATEAGVDEEWIERFAPPVRAEQQRIVDRALECHLRRPRSAPSAVPLRRAVGMSLADKGIAYTVAAYEAAWSARLLGHDRWAVTFTYRHRGRERAATWSYDAADDALTTADRAAAQLGYVAPGRAGEDDGETVDGIVGDPAATAARTTAPVADKSVPKKRAAGKKTAAKKTAPKKRAAGKKAVAKKRAAGEKAVAKKTAVERATGKKTEVEKAAVAKTVAGKKTPVTKRVAGKKAAATKAAPEEKSTKTEPTKTKATAEKAAPDRSATEESSAKQVTPEAAAPVERTPPPVVADPVDVPRSRDLPDDPPRSGVVPEPTPLPDGRTHAPGTNSRQREDGPAPAVRPRPEPGADDVDPTSARRARAAQRNAPTVHFRSGPAAVVRAARDPEASGAPEDRPSAPDDQRRPGQRETNGAARPATRRRRQLRAR